MSSLQKNVRDPGDRLAGLASAAPSTPLRPRPLAGLRVGDPLQQATPPGLRVPSYEVCCAGSAVT